MIDFTDVILKDVLIHGLVDEEIKKEVLGWTDVDTKTVEETVVFIKAKEMARNAMVSHSDTVAPISSYKTREKAAAKPKEKTWCKSCNTEMVRFVWNQRQKRTIEVKLCLPCWKKSVQKNGGTPREDHKNDTGKPDETSSLIVGAVTHASTNEQKDRAQKNTPEDRHTKQIIQIISHFRLTKWLAKIRVHVPPNIEITCLY